MADNITYRFIQNVGEYFPPGFFTEDFCAKVQAQAGLDAEAMKSLCTPFVALRRTYEEYKNFIVNDHPRIQDAILRTHEWHTALLKVLGYPTENAYAEPYVTAVGEEVTEMIPVRGILRSGDRVSMLIMEMQNLIAVDEREPAGLFEQQYESDDEKSRPGQRYSAAQWSKVIPAEFLDRAKYRFTPAVINKAVTQIFLMPEERRPKFILMLAGNTVFLFSQEKWARGAYLQFSFDDLYAQAQLSAYRNHYALFHLLVCKQTLAADGETALMDELIEQSYKNAYEVTKDLKEGVILAVETLANEALHYMRNVADRPFGKRKLDADGNAWYDETDDSFEAEVKDDCLVIVYRLLFILFAESRPELDILPTGDEVYKRGYSFEALRDLEQVRLVSDESRNGYFFDDSVRHLFAVLAKGYNTNAELGDKSFRTRPVDSPIFDDSRLRQLGDVRVRNVKWQEIIRALSLSHGKKHCGRISYANLGVNQLGSVYESLLAYRGFYAEEDYIEVHKAGKPKDGTWLVPYSRMGAFDVSSEVVLDEETGEPRRLAKGTFVYRLNGRDRQKSASYYTPEVLTRSTVKYTIKSFVDEVRSGKRKPADLLDLKILEPAVGAAAFLNEAINQVAEAYMTQVEKKPAPDRYRDELQKVKAYIATHNVYGVDLNPTAIELGKLSLWLNVIHKDMETPFFANRVAVGNAVIGAWLKCYSRDELVAKRGTKCEWWTKAPHAVGFYKNRVNRPVNDVWHFLLPDKGMLAALGVKEMKKAHPDEASVMAKRLKDWTRPVSDLEFRMLQRISAKVDVLLREAFETQISIERLTVNKAAVWGMSFAPTMNLESFAEKERIFDSRYRRDNAYYKLKLVMDYWCALWFWDYAAAKDLPTREEWWSEVENLLDVPDDRLDANTRRALERGAAQEELPLELPAGRMSEEEAGVIAKSKAEILEGVTAQLSLFPELEPERFKIVRRLSERYRFFHPMLEFIEVFWLRGGFDIICGNPPWIKWTYEPQVVVGDKYPEYIIAEKYDADAFLRILQETDYMHDSGMKKLCEAEEHEVTCMASMQNSSTLYPALRGSQSDLFKSILFNALEMVATTGRVGMVHPNTVFDEAKGQTLRGYFYPRVRNVFQYENRFKLFAEVHPEKIFDICVYGSPQEHIKFDAMSNVYHPSTIDSSYHHSGQGFCQGREIVGDDGRKHVSIEGHRDRIIHYDEQMMRLVANVFEGTDQWRDCKLVSIHSQKSVEILSKLSDGTHLECLKPSISEGYHATNSLKDNTVKKATKYPDYDAYEMMFNSTQVNLLSPFAKLPQMVCEKDSQYDAVDYTLLGVNDIIRTNYVPKASIVDFKRYVKDGEAWFTKYKMAFKKMLDITHERTLKGAIIPPKASHMHSIISATFPNASDLVLFAGLSSSIVLDYFIKTVGCKNLTESVMNGLPFARQEKLARSIMVRVLRLNCVNVWYKDLWEELYDGAFSKEEWSQMDNRLSSFAVPHGFSEVVPLRNDFERRLALVEIDVLSAIALGLSLEDLLFIYTNTFTTTQKYDVDTWFDKNGRVVFTAAKGSPLQRPTWNTIKDQHPGETYEHTLTSELYNGRKITYEAPYRRCDRVADYRRAWAFFEERLKGL